MSAPSGAERDGFDSDAELRLVESRRVLVVGPSGSGKTTLSMRLADLLDLEVIHLDAEFWMTGWVRTPPADWRTKVSALAARSSWIMDGTYEDSLDLRLPRAQTVIVLRASRLASLWGIVRRRVISGRRSRVDAPAGQRLDASFLRYVWRFPQEGMLVIERGIESHGAEINRIDLIGRRSLGRFVRRIQERMAGPGGEVS